MKALALLITLAATTTLAHEIQKDVLVCGFTEPFITITYDAATGKITESGMNNWDEEKQEFVDVVIAENGKLVPTKVTEYGYEEAFKLVGDNDEVILEATLDFQGSDGMSDNIYPFSSLYQVGPYAGTLHGGCSTKASPAVDVPTVVQSLKR